MWFIICPPLRIKRNTTEVWFSLNCHLRQSRIHTKLNFVGSSVPGSFYEHKFSIERNVVASQILISFKYAITQGLLLFHNVYGYYETLPWLSKCLSALYT